MLEGGKPATEKQECHPVGFFAQNPCCYWAVVASHSCTYLSQLSLTLKTAEWRDAVYESSKKSVSQHVYNMPDRKMKPEVCDATGFHRNHAARLILKKYH